jgi:hypothetical protein
MILRNFLLADAITFAPDGKLFVHGGGIGKLYATHFPWPQPQLAAFVTLIGEPEDEVASQRSLTLAFVAPDGSELPARVGGTFAVPPREKPEVPQIINFSTQFVGAVFDDEGVYWLRVSLDGEELARMPVEVERREAPTQWRPLDSLGQ